MRYKHISERRQPKFSNEYSYIMRKLGGIRGFQMRAILGTLPRDVKKALKLYHKDIIERKERHIKSTKYLRGRKVIPIYYKTNGYRRFKKFGWK